MAPIREAARHAPKVTPTPLWARSWGSLASWYCAVPRCVSFRVKFNFEVDLFDSGNFDSEVSY